MQTSIHFEFINVIEHLLSTFIPDFKTEWWIEFGDIINSLAKVILPFNENFPKELGIFWFLIKLTEQEDQAIDLVMEQMPITSLLVDFMSSDYYDHFVVAVRFIGNILSSTNSEYI